MAAEAPMEDATCDTLPDRCPACGHTLHLVECHGHTQCMVCKQVISPCCQPEESR